MKLTIRYPLIIFLLLNLFLYCCFASDGFTKASASQTLKGVKISDLDDTNRAALFNIMRKFDCPCGCNKGDLVTCRNADDENCSVSMKMANLIKNNLQAGLAHEQIEKNAEIALNKIEEKIKFKKERFNKFYNIDTEGAHFIGKADAKHKIIAFLDFQCPYCTKGYKIYKELVKLYPDDLKFVFMHNPLSMHKKAVDIAAVAEAAGAQGKFFEMVDFLFDNKGRYSDEMAIKHAAQLQLDMPKFKNDMASEDMYVKVYMGKEEAEKHSITGTPTVILNNKMVKNSYDLEYFKGLIEAELKKK